MAFEIIAQLGAGGPIMIPIGVLSVLGLMSFLERLWNLPRSSRKGREELEVLIGKIVGHTERQNLLEEKGRQLVGDLEKRTFLLGITATVSPMLGLLGTVLGMIITFQDIQTSGVGDASALAGGISQALITTLAGLSVGIPALIAHRWLQREIDVIALGWEAFCREKLQEHEQ